jgi:hypothetical protein
VPLEAVRTVSADDAGVRIVDIKHCVGVVKVPGGESNASRGLSGVVLNKDTAHPQTHRRVLKPRMVLLVHWSIRTARADEGRGIERNGLCTGRSNLGGTGRCDGGLRTEVER